MARAYRYKVLRSIEMGLASWGDSFDSLKQPFFLPTALLTDSTNKPHVRPPPRQPSSSPSGKGSLKGRGACLATLFPVVKSVTRGPGMMTAKPMSAPSVTPALCAVWAVFSHSFSWAHPAAVWSRHQYPRTVGSHGGIKAVGFCSSWSVLYYQL